jgi:HNH endonuclease/NUMOD4 motif
VSAAWRPVPGWAGYEASTDGRVRSWRQRGFGAGRLRGVPLILRSWRQSTGYTHVGLCAGRGQQRSFAVHRLVLMAFRGPCPPGQEAAHLNGLKTDNRLDNLRWATHAQNMAHRRCQGGTARGERAGRAKLTWRAIEAIRQRYLAGATQAQLAREHGVGRTTIGFVVRRVTWVRREEVA